MNMRKAHIVNPHLEVFPMLGDRYLMIIMTEIAGEVALELLLICD